MSEMRAIRARYADWRPVKGRKVLQIVLEVPLEQQGDILTMLGAPLPDRDLWVAVARISDEQNTEAFKGGELARRAGAETVQHLVHAGHDGRLDSAADARLEIEEALTAPNAGRAAAQPGRGSRRGTIAVGVQNLPVQRAFHVRSRKIPLER